MTEIKVPDYYCMFSRVSKMCVCHSSLVSQRYGLFSCMSMYMRYVKYKYP